MLIVQEGFAHPESQPCSSAPGAQHPPSPCTARGRGSSHRLQGCLLSGDRLILAALAASSCSPDTFSCPSWLWSPGSSDAVHSPCRGCSTALLGLGQGRCLPPNLSADSLVSAHPARSEAGRLHLCIQQHQAPGTDNPRGLSEPLCLLWVPQAPGMSHTAAICLQGNSFHHERLYKIHWQRALYLGRMTNGDCHAWLLQDFPVLLLLPMIQQSEVCHLHKNGIWNAAGVALGQGPPLQHTLEPKDSPLEQQSSTISQ